ncbi:MAG: hypothetical protein ACLTY7_01090 [Clostridium fessum]
MKCGLQRGDSYEKDVFVHDSSSNERSFGGRMPEGRTKRRQLRQQRQWLSQPGQGWQRVSLLKPVEQRRRTMRGLRIITCFRNRDGDE